MRDFDPPNKPGAMPPSLFDEADGLFDETDRPFDEKDELIGDSGKPFDEPDRLLDELESIKDLLDGESLLEANSLLGEESDEQGRSNIPLLDDLVVNLPPQPALLDIGGIFEDDIETDSPAAAAPKQTFQFPKFTLDVAISDDPLPEPEPAANNAAAIAPSMAVAAASVATSTVVATYKTAAPGSTASPSIQPAAATATAAPIKNATRSVRPNYSRELLIQELVDEFIPQIEAALHERLGQLDNEALLALKDTE